MTASVRDERVRGAAVTLPFRSKTDLVTDFLRNEIQAGRPAAGQRLVVSQVASRLGISKVPVREAVTRLIGEGLLELRPNVGPVVPAFTAHEVIETALMRVAIESTAMDSAVPRHTDETRADLHRLLVRMETATDEFPALNMMFHGAVIATSPYEEMVRSAKALLARAQRYATVHAVPGYKAHAHEEHIGILSALDRGDVAELKQLNEHHVMSAAHQLTDQMRHPG